jgi:hypothetical protein
MTGRRAWLGGALAFAAIGRAGAANEALPSLRVWRDPSCGCCSGWIAHMRAAGFAAEENTVPSVAPARQRLGIPADLLSCHAAQVGPYALEGHVPAAAVLRLLRERPAGVRGLAVPGMPTGSPGMEVPGQPDDTYDVVAFDAGAGRQVFMRFHGGRPA